MSNVEFNDEIRSSQLYADLQSKEEESAMVRWVISSGLATTREAANKVLIAVIVVALALTGFVSYQMIKKESRSQLTVSQQAEILRVGPK